MTGFMDVTESIGTSIVPFKGSACTFNVPFGPAVAVPIITDPSFRWKGIGWFTDCLATSLQFTRLRRKPWL